MSELTYCWVPVSADDEQGSNDVRYRKLERAIRMLQSRSSVIEEELKSSKDNNKALCKMVVDLSVKMDVEVPCRELFPHAVEEVEESSSYKFNSNVVIDGSPYLEIPSMLFGGLKDNVDVFRAAEVVTRAAAMYLSFCTDKTTAVLPFVCEPETQEFCVKNCAEYFSNLRSEKNIQNIIGIIQCGDNFTTCIAEKSASCWFCYYYNDTGKSLDSLHDHMQCTFASSVYEITRFELDENTAKLVNRKSKEEFRSRYEPNNRTLFQKLAGKKAIESADSVLECLRVAFSLVKKSPNSTVDPDIYKTMKDIMQQYNALLGYACTEEIVNYFLELSRLELCFQVIEKLLSHGVFYCVSLSTQQGSEYRNARVTSHYTSLVKLEHATFKKARLALVEPLEKEAVTTPSKRTASRQIHEANDDSSRSAAKKSRRSKCTVSFVVIY